MKKEIISLGAKIIYRVTGKGAPVILLHGFGEDKNIWEALLSSLQNYQVIVPDLAGSGESSPYPHQEVSLKDFAISIAHIAAQEHVDTAHVFGHSMGGYIALEFASMYPEKVASLGLIHSSAYADDAEKVESRRKAMDFISNNGTEAFLKTSTPGLFKDPGLHAEKVEDLLQRGKDFLPDTLIQYYEAMINRNDHISMLSYVAFPLLYIIGYHDKAVPLKLSLQQCHQPAISYVHILRNSAHMGMYEESDKMIDIVNAFLREIDEA